MKLKSLATILLLTGVIAKTTPVSAQEADSGAIFLADPTIFQNKGTFYLLGTGGRDGFLVYTSTDLKRWNGPAGANKGYALIKGQSFGNEGFWAPQLIKRNGIFYMAYTANEHIALAQSKSPLGPFVQTEFKKLSGSGRQIDPFIFFDDDGKAYLYHVRLDHGNRIFVARMKDDLSDIDTTTLKECIHADRHWENTANAEWPVTEGPTVFKYNKKYYLIYSANDFRNPDYAIGYAVSDSPYGPWEKHGDAPLVSKDIPGINGTGHGDLLKDKNGELWYVMHTHFSNEKVAPRRTAIIKLKLENGELTADKGSFRFLETDRMSNKL